MSDEATTKDIPAAVREVCLWLPEAQEKTSHGMPTFHVRNKNFAIFSVNHHGSGQVALWLNAPGGAQAFYCDAEPEHYFRPPYVGPRGWLGLVLNRGLGWNQIASLVREAYENSAPAELVQQIGKTIDIEPPDTAMDPQDIDSMNAAGAQAILDPAGSLCSTSGGHRVQAFRPTGLESRNKDLLRRDDPSQTANVGYLGGTRPSSNANRRPSISNSRVYRSKRLDQARH